LTTIISHREQDASCQAHVCQVGTKCCRSDKSARQQVRQNENAEASSTRCRASTVHIIGMAGLPWRQRTMPASRSLRILAASRPSSDCRILSLSSSRAAILLRANARPLENRNGGLVTRRDPTASNSDFRESRRIPLIRDNDLTCIDDVAKERPMFARKFDKLHLLNRIVVGWGRLQTDARQQHVELVDVEI
jgi:hypothetical protein